MSVHSEISAGGRLLPEALRNQTLRRVDWRFLLPFPKSRKSVCYATGLLASAVELISDCVVDPTAETNSECDLAVAVDPSPSTLRSAWAALRPGGYCYTEWYKAVAGGERRVRHTLKSAGFQGITHYWVWPWPTHSNPRFWLPLQAPGALKYFIRSRPLARRIIRRFGSFVLCLVWRLSTQLGLALPICAIASKQRSTSDDSATLQPPKTEHGDGVEPMFLRIIRDRWSDWGLGSPPRCLSSLLLTGGPRAISKIVSLVFAEADSYPCLAVKMARVPESVDSLRKEAATLRAVHGLRPEALPGVPRVLFCTERGDDLTLVETAVTGIRVSDVIRRHNYADLARKGMQFLAELAGRPEVSPRSVWWNRMVERTLADFSDSFGSVVDRGMLRETAEALNALCDLPLVCEQRDFSPWNVLVDSTGELVVLDWESAELQGLPGLDLLYFLSYLAFSVDGVMPLGPFRESYRRSLDRSSFTGGVTSECLKEYGLRVGINPENWRPLRLLVWLLHSRSEYSHFIADDGGPPGLEKLRSSTFVGLWEEDVRYGN
jgi:hypothetical protein